MSAYVVYSLIITMRILFEGNDIRFPYEIHSFYMFHKWHRLTFDKASFKSIVISKKILASHDLIVVFFLFSLCLSIGSLAQSANWTRDAPENRKTRRKEGEEERPSSACLTRRVVVPCTKKRGSLESWARALTKGEFFLLRFFHIGFS